MLEISRLFINVTIFAYATDRQVEHIYLKLLLQYDNRSSKKFSYSAPQCIVLFLHRSCPWKKLCTSKSLFKKILSVACKGRDGRCLHSSINAPPYLKASRVSFWKINVIKCPVLSPREFLPFQKKMIPKRQRVPSYCTCNYQIVTPIGKVLTFRFLIDSFSL